MHSPVLEDSVATGTDCIAAGVGSEELSRFCASMTEGLHALAQPLTILRTAVVGAAEPGVAPDRQRRYMDLSTEQVKRACDLFEGLQDLVIAHQVEADCAPFDLSELLAGVVEEEKTSLETSGVELKIVSKIVRKMVATDRLRPVLGDVARTLQALFALLRIAVSVACAGDVIELVLTPRSGFAELVIHNRRVHHSPLNSSQRLSLALAGANIRSQHGRCACVEDPFDVLLALPLGSVVR